MADHMGYVVVEFNQASGAPRLEWLGDLYDRREDAEAQAAEERAETAKVGRRERYALAEVVLVEEPS